MKLFRSLMLLFTAAFVTSHASGQLANASINLFTLNNGIVNQGGTVDLQVSIGNTGPTSSIGINKVRATISIPAAIALAADNSLQTGLPQGWIITSNTGGVITICNGNDVIPVGVQRQIFIKIRGITVGGPSTISGVLAFGNGTSCTAFGTLQGDITSDNNSQSTIQVVAAPSCSLTGVTAAAGTIACNGGTTTLTATPAGTTAVEYSLNGSGTFQPGNTFTVPAGTYTVTARETGTPACSATATAVTITQPPAVTAPVIGAVTQPNCTIAAGSIELSGLPAGNWTITRSPGGTTTGTGAGITINGLAADIYTFTVTNDAGCTSPLSASVTINAQPSTPTVPVPGTITQPTCAVSTGTVELSGLPAGNWTINPGAITGSNTTTTVNGLAPGTYNFTVTNTDGCTSAATADVIINTVAGAPSAPTVTIAQSTCTVATGTITVTSPVAGLTFSIDGGPYTTYPAGGYVVAAGDHTITSQNVSNCISPVVHAVINPQPPIPAAPTANVVHPTCSANGTITVTSSTTGLTFSLDGNTFAAYPAGGYPAPAGVHTLRVQNANGCISPATNITVNAQPTPPTVLLSAGTITCNGATTTLTATASGGTGNLEYSLNGGTFQPVPVYTVNAGTYTVAVRDENGCTATSSILTITQPGAITASISAPGANACNGGTVTLIVAASGGTGALEYSLNNGPYQSANTFTVSGGVYTVSVRAAANPSCTVTTSPVTVTQPAGLTVTVTANRITQCGGTTEVTVAASGGQPPYSSGVGTFRRGPGTFNFSVTDANGCTTTKEFTIEAPGCKELIVFPNPAGNTININHSIAAAGSSMVIFSMSGSRVLTKAVPLDAFQTTIDVTKLAAGSYVLVFMNGNDKKQTLFEKLSSR